MTAQYGTVVACLGVKAVMMKMQGGYGQRCTKMHLYVDNCKFPQAHTNARMHITYLEDIRISIQDW